MHHQYGIVHPAPTIVSVWCSHVFGHRVSGIWGCGVFSVCCRVFYCCHRVCARVPSDWPQTRATGSAAHPPSTQLDGNGKPVCIHLLPASFVCAVKMIFLLRTSDKKCKTKWDLAPGSVFTAHKNTRLWSPGIPCPLMIKIFCGTSTLMLVRGQFVHCVFALHAPVRSSAVVLQTPHCQPLNQWTLGCRCLRLL